MRAVTRGTASTETLGIVPRALRELVAHASANDGKVALKASYLEIYQEHVIDLLSSRKVGGKSAKFSLIREQSDSLHLPEVIETPISSVQEAMELMRQGNINRHQAE